MNKKKNKIGFILWRDEERIVASAFGWAFGGCRKFSNFFPLFYLYFLPNKKKMKFYLIKLLFLCRLFLQVPVYTNLCGLWWFDDDDDLFPLKTGPLWFLVNEVNDNRFSYLYLVSKPVSLGEVWWIYKIKPTITKVNVGEDDFFNRKYLFKF